jgi:hypothetical protein
LILAAFLAVAVSCQDGPELTLRIRIPEARKLFQAVIELNVTASRDGVVLAQRTFSASTTRVSLSSVSHGPRTVITLDGVDVAGEIIARGQTCPVDFSQAGLVVPLYFAPTNFFSPTVGPPVIERRHAVGSALADGTVLVAGGLAGDGTVLASTELFLRPTATFATHTASLLQARARAQASYLPGIGLLITGGIGAAGKPLGGAELYRESSATFMPVADPRLDARVGHRMVLLPDGRSFISGGSASAAGGALATTVFVFVSTDGTYQVSPGPPLAEARREHAATVAIGVPMVFGGYGLDGYPLSSIEALDPGVVPAVAAPPIGRLNIPRAEATASALPDGSILLVGGVGPEGRLQATAELFNPVTRASAVYELAFARRGHTATVLGDGRVLIAGGVDEAGAPIDAVELFAPGIEFVNERSLTTRRGGHLAVPLCDGTVLLLGGGEGGEVYSGSAD